MTVIEHLEELRKRLFYIVGGLLAGVAVGWFLAPRLLELLLEPARRRGAEIIFLSPGEAFFTLLRLSFWLGLLFALPMILYQTSAFVWPALSKREKRVALLLAPSIPFLFLGGVLFSWYVLVPIVFRFFLQFSGEGLTANLSLANYIGFVMNVTLPFGFTFQWPILVAFLSSLGIIGSRLLSAQRRFAIVGIFILAAVLTPPDVVSQLIMAFPLLILYEVGIVIARVIERRSETMQFESKGSLEQRDDG